MSMARTHVPEIGELTDAELGAVSGGGIGAFLTELGNGIRNILATGSAGGHGPGAKEPDRYGAMSSNYV